MKRMRQDKTGKLFQGWFTVLQTSFIPHVDKYIYFYMFRCGVWGQGLREEEIFLGQNAAYSASLRAVACAGLKDFRELNLHIPLSPYRSADHGRTFSVLLSGMEK